MAPGRRGRGHRSRAAIVTATAAALLGGRGGGAAAAAAPAASAWADIAEAAEALAEEADGCRALRGRAECLATRGCRWFSFQANDPCVLCRLLFQDPSGLTGCHGWEPVDFCSRMVFSAAEPRYGGQTSDPLFRDLVRHFSVEQGSGEEGDPFAKAATCSVWCDDGLTAQCFGQPRTTNELKGVNYGGRFIPESWMGLAAADRLFNGITHPSKVGGAKVDAPSLCDVGTAPDARRRMEEFLDSSIRLEHFERMAALGFNIVRLPLGYWNIIDLPGASTPNGAGPKRWRQLQSILSPAILYYKWIDRIFAYAKRFGLKVLLDLHGAPGSQAPNAFTGCHQGRAYFDTKWNRHLATLAITEMAKICSTYGEICWGIELLNEPWSPGGPSSSSDPGNIPREHLLDFYQKAIRLARRYVAWNKPLVVMDWPAWLRWWQDNEPFAYKTHGHIVFATHLYHLEGDIKDQWILRQAFAEDLSRIEDFRWHSRYDVMVSEYALANSVADYNSLANWYVHQFNQHAMGSIVWNFDAANGMPSWGAVAAEKVGPGPVQWKHIFGGAGF